MVILIAIYVGVVEDYWFDGWYSAETCGQYLVWYLSHTIQMKTTEDELCLETSEQRNIKCDGLFHFIIATAQLNLT